MNFIIIFLFYYLSIVSAIIKFPKTKTTEKEVSACIHSYLEKEFLSLSGIIFPKSPWIVQDSGEEKCYKRDRNGNPRGGGRAGVLMDGQELAYSCANLYEVLKCLGEEMERTDIVSEFYILRDIVYSLVKVLNWLCGSKIIDNGSESTVIYTLEMRTRFLALLESIECLECVREDIFSLCYTEGIGSNGFWVKILRMEVDSRETCPLLNSQLDCYKENQVLSRYCGQISSDLYQNMTSLFMSIWCKGAINGSNNLNKNNFPIMIIFLQICKYFYKYANIF